MKLSAISVLWNELSEEVGKGKAAIALFPLIPCDFLSLLLHFLFELPKKPFSLSPGKRRQ